MERNTKNERIQMNARGQRKKERKKEIETDRKKMKHGKIKKKKEENNRKKYSNHKGNYKRKAEREKS